SRQLLEHLLRQCLEGRVLDEELLDLEQLCVHTLIKPGLRRPRRHRVMRSSEIRGEIRGEIRAEIRASAAGDAPSGPTDHRVSGPLERDQSQSTLAAFTPSASCAYPGPRSKNGSSPRSARIRSRSRSLASTSITGSSWSPEATTPY